MYIMYIYIYTGITGITWFTERWTLNWSLMETSKTLTGFDQAGISGSSSHIPFYISSLFFRLECLIWLQSVLAEECLDCWEHNPCFYSSGLEQVTFLGGGACFFVKDCSTFHQVQSYAITPWARAAPWPHWWHADAVKYLGGHHGRLISVLLWSEISKHRRTCCSYYLCRCTPLCNVLHV